MSHFGVIVTRWPVASLQISLSGQSGYETSWIYSESHHRHGGGNNDGVKRSLLTHLPVSVNL
jgi:hypothetical protein